MASPAGVSNLKSDCLVEVAEGVETTLKVPRRNPTIKIANVVPLIMSEYGQATCSHCKESFVSSTYNSPARCLEIRQLGVQKIVNANCTTRRTLFIKIHLCEYLECLPLLGAIQARSPAHNLSYVWSFDQKGHVLCTLWCRFWHDLDVIGSD